MSTILGEIKQSRPFPSPGLETGVSLLRTAVLLRRKLEKDMSAHGLTLQQFNVLRILRGAGMALPTMEIADRMVEPEPGITRLLGRIEQKGLITRTQCDQDRRRILARITRDGVLKLDQIGEPTDYLAQGDVPLSEEELETLLTLLSKARQSLD